MPDFICTIQYNGRNFCGWVKQKEAKTIQGEIEKAIAIVTKTKDFKTIGASKTDSGVHALGQKMLLVLKFKPNIEGFLKALNSNLFPDINIVKMQEVGSDFLIRNCLKKQYSYNINIGPVDIFNNDFEYLIKQKFNLEKFKAALNIFKGEHNFFNFSGLTRDEAKNIKTVRTIDFIDVIINNKKIKVVLQAKSFIRYQIRRIIGASIAYAQDKIELNVIDKLLTSSNVEKLKYIAEPKGLILEKIWY